MSDKVDVKQDWAIGFDDEKNPSVMNFSIPFKKWAEDGVNGQIMLVGFFEFANQMAKKNILIYNHNKSKAGLITPNGKPD